MQFKTVLASLVLATAVSAKGGKNSTSVKSQCKDLAQLTKLTELAGNDTKLAAKFDNNQTKIDAFKAKAADATTQISTLQANATLVEACSVIAAHAEAVNACGSMLAMEKAIATAANDTKLTEKFKGNTTKIDAFKAKASTAATKLTDLQSNSTLTAFCSVQADAESCQQIKSLQKDIAMASNTTALDNKFKGNATKIQAFQDKAAKLQTKLDAMTGNSTLMSTCTSLAQASKDGSVSNGAAQATSAAGRIEGSISAVAIMVVGFAAFML